MGHECTMAEMFHGQCGALDTAMAAMLVAFALVLLAVAVGGFIAMVRK